MKLRNHHTHVHKIISLQRFLTGRVVLVVIVRCDRSSRGVVLVPPKRAPCGLHPARRRRARRHVARAWTRRRQEVVRLPAEVRALVPIADAPRHVHVRLVADHLPRALLVRVAVGLAHPEAAGGDAVHLVVAVVAVPVPVVGQGAGAVVLLVDAGSGAVGKALVAGALVADEALRALFVAVAVAEALGKAAGVILAVDDGEFGILLRIMFLREGSLVSCDLDQLNKGSVMGP